MTIVEIKKIEPVLFLIEKYAKDINDKSKGKIVYWVDVWKILKNKSCEYIGFMAQNKILRNSEVWDLWHNHLKSICKNLR